MSEAHIAAIVVTFNRLELLRECIAAIRGQTRPADEIIVVDNGSTDGTAAWLASQSGLTIVTQPNGGSSGGQYTGIKTAYEHGHDWFWCMDDDTIPTATALERLTASVPFGDEQSAYLASLVLWTDGTPHRMNAAYPADDYHNWYGTVLADRVIPIRFASFVSLLVRREAVAEHGLPIKEFFIWGDDFEFTQRIGAGRRGWLVLDSKALHKTAKNLGAPLEGEPIPADMVDKYCYGLRNRVYMLRRSTRSPLLRVRLLLVTIRRYAFRVLRGEVPAKVLWWCLKGIRFNPTIDFVAANSEAATVRRRETVPPQAHA